MLGDFRVGPLRGQTMEAIKDLFTKSFDTLKTEIADRHEQTKRTDASIDTRKSDFTVMLANMERTDASIDTLRSDFTVMPVNHNAELRADWDCIAVRWTMWEPRMTRQTNG